MRHKLEYAPVWLILNGMAVLPLEAARFLGISLGFLIYALHGRLRRVGLRNLEMAMPEKSPRERRKIVRGVFRTLGRQLADFCHLPNYDLRNIDTLAVHEGFESFDAARARGKG